MVLVLTFAAALWFLGAAMKVPRRSRAVALGAIYLGILALQLLLPGGHPLRLATGGSALPWLVLGGIAALVWAYRLGLRKLRDRAHGAAADPATPQSPAAMEGAELERYARHIVLREIGGTGQRKLKQARVLVIGAGGLGSPALLYLAAAGVGQIGVVDDDVVEGANLQRQVIHSDARIGMPKVFSAERAMKAINPWLDVRPYHRRLGGAEAAALVAEYDLVLDGTDNFDTRYLVNRAAVAAGKPLISGALSQWEGQLSLFDPARGTPCYQCIFPAAPAPHLAPSCAEAGVLGPLPGVIGTMMAVEAVKAITGAGQGLSGRMQIYDALYGENRVIGLKRRADCPVCGSLQD